MESGKCAEIDQLSANWARIGWVAGNDPTQEARAAMGEHQIASEIVTYNEAKARIERFLMDRDGLDNNRRSPRVTLAGVGAILVDSTYPRHNKPVLLRQERV